MRSQVARWSWPPALWIPRNLSDWKMDLVVSGRRARLVVLLAAGAALVEGYDDGIEDLVVGRVTPETTGGTLTP